MKNLKILTVLSIINFISHYKFNCHDNYLRQLNFINYQSSSIENEINHL